MLQIHLCCYQYAQLPSQNETKSSKTEEDENLFDINIKNTENNKEIILGTDDEEKRAELENLSVELAATEKALKLYMKQITMNQQSAQMNGSSFVKMITTTTDIAGREICDSFYTIVNSRIQSGENIDIDEIKSFTDEALCKMEIQYSLSNAALKANGIIEEMKAAGVDDSEIRELFENYGNNMDTSIGQTKDNTQNGQEVLMNKKEKNVSKTVSNSDVEENIAKFKTKIQDEKQELKNPKLSVNERIQTEAKLNGHIFLLDMYKSIKDDMKALNNNDFWSKIINFFN